ncbi:unnamed protein product [Calypogeia fissa]
MPKDAVPTSVSGAPNLRSSGSRDDDDDDVVALDTSSASSVFRKGGNNERPGLPSLEKRVSVRDLASKFDRVQSTSRTATTPKGKGNDSVKDLASKFDKVQGTTPRGAAAGKEKLHDRDVQFSKLTGVLKDMQGRVSGRSKTDVDEALNITKSLTALCTQQEAELAHERREIKRLFRLVQQYSGEARNIIEEAHAVAEREIGAVREIATHIGEAFQEHKQTWSANGMDLEEMRRDAHEARRIKMLHESSKTVDMHQQINSLRQQLVGKSAETASLRKELETLKLLQHDGGRLQCYRLSGVEQLGTTLSIEPLDDTVCDLSRCSVQWYRLSQGGNGLEIISGAIRPQYAPEPFDVGRILRAEISMPYGKTLDVQTMGPIDTAPGLDNYVEILFNKGGTQFNVRIVLKNGEMVKKQSLHTFDVSRTRIKLFNSHGVKAKESYSSSMQLCGARGGGDSAAQGLFWVVSKGVTFMLVLESERERNAAILLARRFAKASKIFLGGPDDVTPLEG